MAVNFNDAIQLFYLHLKSAKTAKNLIKNSIVTIPAIRL